MIHNKMSMAVSETAMGIAAVSRRYGHRQRICSGRDT